MSEPAQLSPDLEEQEARQMLSHERRRGRKGSKVMPVAIVGLLSVGLAGGVGAILMTPTDEEIPVTSLVQSSVGQALAPLEEGLARVEKLQNELEQRLVRIDERLEQAERFVADSDTAIGVNRTRLERIGPRLAGLGEGLTRLDSELNLRVTAQNEQIQTLGERIEQSQRPEVAPRPAPARQARRPAAPPSPPFQLSGIESRGGRPYVGVFPKGVTRLRDIRLLGAGDRQDGWELAEIRRSEAVFTRNGQSVNVPLP